MSITLTLSLLPDGSPQLSGFTQFWLRYVHGFSPHFHCQKSLRGFNDPRFKRDMALGGSFDLLEPGRYDYIYLCGVTAQDILGGRASSEHRPPRSQEGSGPGLHLALAPDPSSTARAVTYNGIEIMVRGARRLEISPLPDGFAGMSRKYTTCCNWQFGVEYYGLAGMRRELVRE